MKTVYVGLSGGVDSAVSAALLKQQGHNVVGAFIKIWRPEFIECTWKEDRLDALRVAASLNIPFVEIDLSDEYRKEVVDSMLIDYERGITPNPDVLCNQFIKFGSFYDWARTQGADYVATGHYARTDGNNLLRGIDAAKDQSYFLYRIKGQQLPHVLFPIGAYKKTDVREMAKRFELPVAQRPDSQGLCFIGDVSLPEFLKRFIPLREGAVVDTTGKVVGTHEGAALYTIGQRHGFTVQASIPYYIVRIDTKSNVITVSSEKDNARTKRVNVVDTHWINDTPSVPHEFDIQARYHETPVRATLDRRGEHFETLFANAHIVSPGQSIVFYSGDTCVGGGVISL